MKKTMRKRILAFAVSVLMIISILPLGIYAADELPEGTAVTSAAEFAAMQADGTYYLANDITITATYANEFSGTFNGNGKTITTSCAIFDKVAKGTVENFTVRAAAVKITLPSGGAAVCNTAFGGTFRNITNTAALEATDTKNNHGLAAIVGVVEGSASEETTLTIENCVNKGNIKGTSNRSHAAGMLGFALFTKKELVNIEITGCRNEGDVDAAKAGGIACYLEGVKSTTVKGCSNLRNLISYNLGGGIIAQITRTCTELTVEDCVNSGNIAGTNNIYNGGIVGICQIVGDAFDCNGKIAFRRCVNSGTITGVGAKSHTGGLIGRHYGALVEYCGNTGLVENADACGGIVGHMENATIIRYCYNLGTVKSTVYAGGIVAVSKVPVDKIYGCYNAGTITMEETFNPSKYNMAQVVSITSKNLGEYYDNFYLEGMTFVHQLYGTLEIPCNAIGNTPVNDDSYAFKADDMASGKLAADMNEVIGKNVYQQKLSGTKDAYPTPGSNQGTVVKAGETYLNLAIETAGSAATRLEENGLKFTTTVSKADYDALLAAGVQASDVSVGTMITFVKYVEALEADRLSFNMADFDIAGKAYIDDTGTLAEEDGRYVFSGAVVNIPEANFEKTYCAIGYIQIGDAVYYSVEYAQRSVSDVAEAAYADRVDAQTEGYANAIAADSAEAIDGKVSYSPYTEAQLADLKAKKVQK